MLRSTSWALGLQLVTKSAMLVFSATAAHVLPLAQTGLVFSLQGAMLVITVGVDAGTSTWTLRAVSAGAGAEATMASAQRVRAATAGVLGAVTVVVVSWRPDLAGWAVPTALGGWVIATGALHQSVLSGLHDFRRITTSFALGRLTLALGAVASLVLPQDGTRTAHYLLWLVVVAEAVTTWRLRSTWLRHRSVDGGAAMPVRQVLLESLPHAANSATNVIYNRADTTLVAVFSTTVTAGLYAPASQVQNALGSFLSALSVGVMPAARLGRDEADGADLTRRAARQAALLGVTASSALALVLALSSPWWVPLAFGESYRTSLLPFVLLLLSLPLAAVEIPYQQVVVARGLAARMTVLYAFALVVTLVAHATLDARFGAPGAATASLVREPIMLAGVLLLALRARPATRRTHDHA